MGGVLVVAAGVAIAILALHGGWGRVAAFNACIGQKQFLRLTVARSTHRTIETITDRAQGTVMGEFAILPSARAAARFTSTTVGPPNGSGTSNGRMVLFTRAPTGRDAQAILTCGDIPFPGA